MTPEERREMEAVAELTVQRFFNHYLTEVWPEQLAMSITAHNSDVSAHAPQIKSAVSAATDKLKVWTLGLVFSGGVAGGATLAKLLS